MSWLSNVLAKAGKSFKNRETNCASQKWFK
jgi:hypothetical protein